MITEIPSTDQKLAEFARSFGHEIDPRLKTFVAVGDDGEWLGYLQIIPQPSTISGWKPGCGKETIKAVREMKNYCLSLGVGITWCSPESPLHQFMERLGFKKPGMEVFFALPDNPKESKG